MALEQHLDWIRHLIQEKQSYEDISVILKSHGVGRGCSAANIRHFCKKNGINVRSDSVDDGCLKLAVSEAIQEVGPAYGRRMMTGYLKTKGVVASEKRVGAVLKQSHRPYHRERQQGVRERNPLPYYAECFGHKLHLDQNEKLGMFGATHVLAIDGFSSYIVAWDTMPMKNNIRIYDQIFRSSVLSNGLWDTIRVDHGREFFLTLYMQDKLSEFRRVQTRQPYVQSGSKHNLRVERIWPEVNARVNYPIKTALVEMVDADDLDMEDPIQRYCTSELTMHVARIGMERCVSSWNEHRIAGRGVPSELKRETQQNGVAPPALVCDGDEAARAYRAEGGTLTDPASFAQNPFPSDTESEAAMNEFNAAWPDLQPIMDSAVNRDTSHFKNALSMLIEIVQQYVP